MSKLFLIVIVAAIVALVMGGALEIKFHPEELATVPEKIMAYFQGSGLFDKGVAQIDKLKKDGTKQLIDRYTGSVAGTKDDKEATPTPTPSSTIPLQF